VDVEENIPVQKLQIVISVSEMVAS